MTMHTTVSEKVVCPVCGAVVRPGALFCYNCGGSLSVEEKDGSKALNPNPAVLPERAERRRRREPAKTEIIWEQEAGPNLRVVFMALAISVIVAVITVIALIVR